MTGVAISYALGIGHFRTPSVAKRVFGAIGSRADQADPSSFIASGDETGVGL
jgi:hypothetical protein